MKSVRPSGSPFVQDHKKAYTLVYARGQMQILITKHTIYTRSPRGFTHKTLVDGLHGLFVAKRKYNAYHRRYNGPRPPCWPGCEGVPFPAGCSCSCSVCVRVPPTRLVPPCALLSAIAFSSMAHGPLGGGLLCLCARVFRERGRGHRMITCR